MFIVLPDDNCNTTDKHKPWLTIKPWHEIVHERRNNLKYRTSHDYKGNILWKYVIYKGTNYF